MALLGQFRGDTLENWMLEDPIVNEREFILISSEENPLDWDRCKVGDGVHKFSELPIKFINVAVSSVYGTSLNTVVNQNALTTVLNEILTRLNALDSGSTTLPL